MLSTRPLPSKRKHIFLFCLVLILTGGFLPPEVVQALCIKDKKANLREGPGTHHKKLWEVPKYMPFKKIRRKGDWLQVQDLDGDKYWVYRKLTTTKYKCAVIKDWANLREGPGTNFPKVPWSPTGKPPFRMPKYFPMKVLKIKNSWVRVEASDGDQAWIYRPLVWIQ